MVQQHSVHSTAAQHAYHSTRATAMAPIGLSGYCWQCVATVQPPWGLDAALKSFSS